MGKPKFGGVQEVARAAWRNPGTLLGLLQTAPETLSPQHAAGSSNSRFLGVDNLPERLRRPGRWQRGFRAPSVRRGHGSPNAQRFFCRSRLSCGFPLPCGRRSLNVC